MLRLTVAAIRLHPGGGQRRIEYLGKVCPPCFIRPGAEAFGGQQRLQIWRQQQRHLVAPPEIPKTAAEQHMAPHFHIAPEIALAMP